MNKTYLLEQLYLNVARMRSYQKQFFKQKDKHNLEMSKKLEKSVDNILGMLRELENNPK